MTFSTVRISEWVATCDECCKEEVLHTGEDGVRTINGCKAYLRSHHWSFGKKTLCPMCNKKSPHYYEEPWGN